MKHKALATKATSKKITETSSNKFNLNSNKNSEIGMIFLKQANTNPNLLNL